MKNLTVITILMTMPLQAFSVDIRYELQVDGLACPFCAYGVEKKIKALNGVNKDSVAIKLNEGMVIFEAGTGVLLTEQSLKTLINDAGFTLRQVNVYRLNPPNKPE